MSGNQSLDRGLQLLALLDEETEALGVREAGRKLGVSPTIAQRLLQTLVAHHFAMQEPETARYRLGYRALALGRGLLNDENLVSSAYPEIRSLAQNRQLNTFLSVIVGDSLVYVLTEQSSGPISIRSKPGSRARFHTTAMGKMLLADKSDEEIDRLLGPGPLEPVTRHSITDPAALRAQIREAEQRGYALVVSENLEGVTSVASRIRNAAGETVAAISVAYAPSLQPATELPEMVQEVVASANRISERLGCPAPLLKAPQVSLKGQSDVA